MIVTRYVCNNSNELPRNLQATIGRIISGINTIFLSCGKYTRELNSLLILPRINCDVTSSRSIVRLDRHPPLIFHRLLFTRNSDPRRGRAGIRFQSEIQSASSSVEQGYEQRSRPISRSVMKIPGCIDMHLQDSTTNARSPLISRDFNTFQRNLVKANSSRREPPFPNAFWRVPPLKHLSRIVIECASSAFRKQDKSLDSLSNSYSRVYIYIFISISSHDVHKCTITLFDVILRSSLRSRRNKSN